MVDIVDKAVRSRIMSGIRGKDTKPEMKVRRFLHAVGFRYRLHVRDLPGRPDIVLPKYRTVVQVHGCFWHRHAGCRSAAMPASNVEMWSAKFARNIERDREVERQLIEMGWRVLTVWECDCGLQRPQRGCASHAGEAGVFRKRAGWKESSCSTGRRARRLMGGM